MWRGWGGQSWAGAGVGVAWWGVSGGGVRGGGGEGGWLGAEEGGVGFVGVLGGCWYNRKKAATKKILALFRVFLLTKVPKKT